LATTPHTISTTRLSLIGLLISGRGEKERSHAKEESLPLEKRQDQQQSSDFLVDTQ